MTFKESILYVLLWPYYHAKFRFVIDYGDFDKDRIDPYILLANHASLHDAFYMSILIKRKYPFPVVNAFIYQNRLIRFLLTKIVHSVAKRKGQSDIATVKGMLDLIRNKKRSVLLFPEGNSSYFGKESPIPLSTAKLLKVLKVDCILAKISGGYLAAPRWGRPVKKGLIDVKFSTLYKAEELKDLAAENIYERLCEVLPFNDYDWNRTRKQTYDLRHRAEGLESFIYVCPVCHGHQCLHTRKNRVLCRHCGEIAAFDEYGLLQGLPFDNLIEWDKLQKAELPRITSQTLSTTGKFHRVDFAKSLGKNLGMVEATIDQGVMNVRGLKFAKEFQLAEMSGIVLTKKRDLSFDYEDETYYIAAKDPMLFLDAITHIKGGLIHG